MYVHLIPTLQFLSSWTFLAFTEVVSQLLDGLP